MTPDLKALALAAIEADWNDPAQRAFRNAATPERILQLENEVLDDVLKVLGRFSLQTEITDAIRSLKTKEPDPLGEALNSGDGVYRP